MIPFRYGKEDRAGIAAAAPVGVDLDALFSQLELLATQHLVGETTPAKRLERIAELCEELAAEIIRDDVVHVDLGLNGEVLCVKITRNDDDLFAPGLTVVNYTVTRERLPSFSKSPEPSAIIAQLESMAKYARHRIAIRKRENASKQERDLFILSVLDLWVDELGGKFGGETSPMVAFARAVCKPVLGRACPNEGSFVTMAYKWWPARAALKIGSPK